MMWYYWNTSLYLRKRDGILKDAKVNVSAYMRAAWTCIICMLAENTCSKHLKILKFKLLTCITIGKEFI